MAIGALVLQAVSAHAASLSIANPSFHDNQFPSPGYGTPSGWNAAGGTGVNPVSGGGSPFSSGASVPDGNDFALIQNNGSLSQNLSGLNTSETHVLQFYTASRNTAGMSNLTVTYGGQTLLAPTAVPKITGGNPYVFYDIPFTPATASGDLFFTTTESAAGDRTLFLDAVSLFTRGADQLVIANPSFEGTGTVAGVGYQNPLAGWSHTGAGQIGANNSSQPFYDNGVTTDGTNVALMQQPGTLSQLIAGFSPGSLYELSYSYNSRTGADPTLQVLIGGIEAQNSAVPEVGGTNAFNTNTFQFTANATEMLLEFNQIGVGGDRTALVDDVSIRFIPEPSATILALFGGLLALRRRR